ILTCSDDMKKLEKTFITNSFIDCVPQEIINYCLTQAQISNKKVSADNFPIRSSLPVMKQNCVDVFKLLNKL
ncbi:MAG TPA: serine/arginine repetitive matrix protein 2, partial [Lactobacillus acetotolerans]|nr:serine/arginine repetitive matrix protein 2 [Lactobacillus acetotolerans]